MLFLRVRTVGASSKLRRTSIIRILPGATGASVRHIHLQIRVRYHANCPECHKMCLEKEERENNYWYSVTCDGNTISSDHITVTCNQQGCDTGD